MARLLLHMLFIIITGFQNLDGALLPGLTCNVTEQTDGSIRYQIFGKPSSTGYESSWEKKNSIVIVAITSQYNESVVKSLKNDSVDLYVCEDFLRYNMQRFEKDGIQSKLTATCEVNCTHLMTKDSPQVDDGFPKWGIPCIVFGVIILLGTIILLIFWEQVLQVCCGSTFQSIPRSQTNGLQSPQSLNLSFGDAIMDNLKNKSVETEDPENPEVVKLYSCN